MKGVFKETKKAKLCMKGVFKETKKAKPTHSLYEGSF